MMGRRWLKIGAGAVIGAGVAFGAFAACDDCSKLDGHIDAGKISDTIRFMVGQRGPAEEAVTVQAERGIIETGLTPAFGEGALCRPVDSEAWAIDYSGKRPFPALHKGIDIPAPLETPILAAASGVVVGKFLNERSRKGIEIMLRHAPEDTGLRFWTYSQYTHLLEMSPLPIGARVAMGDEIGKTSNTGVMGRNIRRDALHFAILYSQSPDFANDGDFVTPRQGFFMDPHAFYRAEPPYDSPAMLALPEGEKAIPVGYMLDDGTVVPEGARRIWPYTCQRTQ